MLSTREKSGTQTPKLRTHARRTQTERTAEARSTLIDAAIGVLHRTGYSGATTAAIANEAGWSRALITHHFGSRGQLMADVISAVYEREHHEYQEWERRQGRSARIVDWPDLLWSVLSKPSGLAVLEILQASRSDPELAALVGPMQARIEERALAGMHLRFGVGDEVDTRAGMRLLVWAIRGLSIAQVLVPDPTEIAESVGYLRRLIESAVASGMLVEQASASATPMKD
jgi:AcrR family transcriptional regulator